MVKGPLPLKTRRKLTTLGPVTPPPEAVDLSDVGPKLQPKDLKIGMVLAYLGDQVPYVESKWLIGKGQKNGGTYMLPGFVTDESGERRWSDLPGSRTDEWRIVAVEENRVDTKGKPLPNLWIFTGSGYVSHRFGLLAGDVCAKFRLVMAPDDFEDINLSKEEKVAAHEARIDWEAQTQSEGW
jgi:hypothetical protein